MILLLWPAAGRAAPAFDAGRDGELVFSSERWLLALDAATGAIRRIEDRAGSGAIVRGGPDLWTIGRHGAAPVVSGDCAFRHGWDAEKAELTLVFDGPEAAVSIVCEAADEGPVWRSEVAMKRGTMVEWRFPGRLEFDAGDVAEFVFPDHLGLAFTGQWFQPGGAGMMAAPMGPEGLLRVTGDRCEMRPVADDSVAVTPGPDAEGWLPQWYREEMPGWRVTANRCPRDGKFDLALVGTAHGPWLTGYRLGGSGWLFRFGGMLGRDDARPRTASVVATLARHWRDSRAGAPGKWTPGTASLRGIGIIQAPPHGRPGGRMEDGGAELARELGRQKWLAEAGVRVVMLDGARSLREALAAPRDWFAIINTAPEGFLAEAPAQAGSMLDAIAGYVRQGGVWWEAGGGYPFYKALVPGRDASFSSANRDFCDFAALRSARGRWSMFGVQAPQDIFVPRGGEVGATGDEGARIGYYVHSFHAYARPGETVRLPAQTMVLGRPHREVLRDHADRCGFATRPMEAKADARVVGALKRGILLKVNAGDFKQAARIAENLPSPVLYHMANYLRGGFDKQYPDHLPPDPAMGTAEEFAGLIRACRGRGHLFMPYTNPTWWCVNPKGPTFERVGEAPLSLGLDGMTMPERYGASATQGYTVCAWHPEVRAANDVIRNQFTRDFPVDVLFQDQVGARDHRWDTNPAAPHPGAYIEGIHRIAQVDARVVPLGTEDGDSRLIDHELIFCGLSFPWLPNRGRADRVLYESLWPEGSWRHEPLALFLAHDRVFFYHHDLGGFVHDRLDVSTTLVMGYGLSWWTKTADQTSAERDWIARLCRLQAAVGPRCAGRRLDDFAYLAPRVIRSRWGDLEVIANLADQPWPVDPDTIIAPGGFAARAPDLNAGIFTRHRGEDWSGAVRWVIREKGDDGWAGWSAGELVAEP